MADSGVQPGLATPSVVGWSVAEPNTGGKFGSVGVFTAPQVAALGGAMSGAQVTVGLDASFRLATLARGANTITVTRPNSTTVVLTLPNAAPLPASVVTITLDASGRVTGTTSNFF